MKIKKLQFTNAGPFNKVEFDFDDQVNVFVGPNNCGKSTTLMALGDIVVFPFGIPKKILRKGKSRYKIRLANGKRLKTWSGLLPITPENKKQWNLHIELLKKIGYTTFVPALRQSTDFRAEGPMVKPKKHREAEKRTPVGQKEAREFVWFIEEEEEPELQKRRALISTEPSLISDEAVVQKMIELDYTAYRRDAASIREVIESIAAMASEITEGFPIRFLRVEQDKRGLFPLFRTPDGDIPLNCLSQGTQSIIQWLAHLLIGYAEYYGYPKDLVEKPGVFIIDDIDAHLHPSWQNRIIPTLTKHFPNLQFFCSTHSPLMLTGLHAGQVHLMKREKNGKVSISRSEKDIIGWSADEILRNFMGVRSPTDIETAQNIDRLQELRSLEKLKPEQQKELDSLRQQIHTDLVSGPFESQLEELRALLTQEPSEPAKVTRRARTARPTRRAAKPKK